MIQINNRYREIINVKDQPEGFRLVSISGPVDPLTGLMTVRLSPEEAEAVRQALARHPEEP